MLFTAPLAGALGFLALWVWQGREALLYGFYGLLAVAVLAKGPTAILLSALTLAAYCLGVGQWRWLFRVLAPGPLLLFLVLAIPWYVAVYLRHGERFIEDFILKHHFRRFTTEELAHPGPWWYYLPVLAGLVFPWTAHLALVVANVAALGWRGLRKDPRRMFLLAWIIPVVIFFSASKAKLPGYVLVTAPALAIWIANELAQASPQRIRGVFLAQALLLPAVLVVAEGLPAALAQGVRSARSSLSALEPDAPLAALVVAGGVVLAWFAWRGRRLGAAVLATALTALALARTIALAAPAVDQLASARPLAQQIRARGIPPSQIALAPNVRRHIEYGLEFYLNHPLERGGPAPYLVTADGRLERAGARE